MFIPATAIRFLKDVTFEMTFMDGKVIRYDMARMFSKYPQLQRLRSDRKLFESGRLDHAGYGVVWDDELDFSASSVYENGDVVAEVETTLNQRIGVFLMRTREAAGLTQAELAKRTHIDQGDISRIERGQGNPTIKKIAILFAALGKRISFGAD